MKKYKYTYNTLIKDLPKVEQDEIYKYIQEGYAMYENGTGEKAEDKISKKALMDYSISDIEELYPVDTLIEELNKEV